jgi:iron-sulfur cluster assembly protein
MAIRLLPKAKEQILRLLETESRHGASGLRIGVAPGGCSGYKYSMELIQNPRPNDCEIESEGIRVYVDPSSTPLIEGLELDYASGLMESGFVFHNPNAKKSCGCGSSFEV